MSDDSDNACVIIHYGNNFINNEHYQVEEKNIESNNVSGKSEKYSISITNSSALCALSRTISTSPLRYTISRSKSHLESIHYSPNSIKSICLTPNLTPNLTPRMISYQMNQIDQIDQIDEMTNKLESSHSSTSTNQNIEYVLNDKPLTAQRKKWICISNLCTFFMPDCLLNKNMDIRQAWREKITIFFIFVIMSAILIWFIHFLPKILCQTSDLYTWKDIYDKGNSESWMVVNGKILDIKKYAKIHPSLINQFFTYSGTDVSYMFDTPDPRDLSGSNLPSNIDIYLSLVDLFLEYKTNDTNRYCAQNYCHPYGSFNDNSSLIIGTLALSYSELLANTNQYWFVLYNVVYNVSDYYKYGHPVYPPKYDYETLPKEMAYYLDQRLNLTILSRCGNDATELFEQQFQLSDKEQIIQYLNKFYYAGILDTRYDIICVIINTLALVLVCIMALILLIKFVTSLFILQKQYPQCRPEGIFIVIPCYSEDKDALERSIYSIFDSNYPTKKKCIFIIVDGLAIGKGNKQTTADILLDIFGRKYDEEDGNSYFYNSIGEHEKKNNKAKIYSGWHQFNDQILPYIIIIKIGLDEEEGNKRGNRGKRDSQLIFLNFLSKYFYKKPLDELGQRILHDIKRLNISISKYKYMLSVDADTYVRSDALMQMVYHMKDHNIFALCGETLVRNKFDNWVTAIQVYEYYLNHNLNKAFESLFSSVTCLPGCFSLYRIYDENTTKTKPILINEQLLEHYGDNAANTLHKKNLLQLGEDRYFTTLITKYFPMGKFKFIIEAKCETTVPNTWAVLISQRRRWINSTLHNLFELMFMDRLCGVCCCSMKFIIFLDILTTILLPVSCGYLIYLLYGFATHTIVIPISFVIFIITLLGTQILIFVIKRDFQFVIWLIIYILALPIWTIVMPIYAFAKMDDFSWGETKKIEE